MKDKVIAIALLFATSANASADCYENIGCSNTEMFDRSQLELLSCQALWEVRNRIYHENGYCFQTDRGLAAFSNDACTEYDAANISMNSYERSNANIIRSVEKSNGC